MRCTIARPNSHSLLAPPTTKSSCALVTVLLQTKHCASPGSGHTDKRRLPTRHLVAPQQRGWAVVAAAAVPEAAANATSPSGPGSGGARRRLRSPHGPPPPFSPAPSPPPPPRVQLRPRRVCRRRMSARRTLVSRCDARRRAPGRVESPHTRVVPKTAR